MDERAASFRAEFENESGAFRAAFEHAAIGKALVDLNGRWLKVNRALCEIVGYSPEELLAIDFQTITHPDDLEADLALARQVVDGRIDHYHMEKRYFHKRGHVVWILLSVAAVRDGLQRPCYFIAQIQDISERKRAEREARSRLQQMERLTQAIASILNAFESAIDDAIFPAVLEIVLKTLDSRAGLFLQLADDGSLQGWSVSSAAASVSWWPASDWNALWRLALAEGATVVENMPCRLAGGINLQRSLVAPILDHGRPVALLHVADRPSDYDDDDRDLLTRIAKIAGSMLSARIERDRVQRARQTVEEELAKHQTELAHVLRVNTMGEMAAGLAHELNQPLSAIANYARGFVRRLSQGGGDVSELMEAANAMAGESRRAAEIIRSLKRYVKKCEPQRSAVDINAVLAAAARIVSGEARRRGISVTVDCAPDLPPVAGDRVQLEQVVVNLLSNGIDALEGSRRDKRIVVQSSLSDDGGVAVRVADNGCGLPALAENQIFEAFFTTKPQGLGMGLAISRSMIEAHGGKLLAESNDRGGATFRFTLPHGGESLHGD